MIPRQGPPRSGRLLAVAATVLVLIGAALAGWAWWRPDPEPRPQVVANNVSERPRVCLAADSATAARGDTVSAVWTALQRSAAARSSNLQQFVEPAADPARAQALLAGLLNRHCALVVTVGPAFATAIAPVGGSSPATTFVAVDSGLTTPPPHTTLLDPADLPVGLEAALSTVTATGGPGR
ncbi:hypothetical protein Kpho02_74230 [Kitasatospora phosalacinea]|uniref:BMP family ABC transporter substrate-binding protein n=1 Tax=Kitasatospora phosalacinea TaxID=2065 RepID=A0A9W6QHP4_9ACTN|nr:hypothetical protein [Kitasatospora phosalacinea]GLW75126.1 hypothetical protein Kpho02_74230 [Kitasatospora phosalacinea]